MNKTFTKLSQSILWKISLFLVFVIFLAGIIQLVFSSKGWRNLIEEIEQQTYWDVAAEYALRIQPLVKEKINEEELQRTLFSLTVLNPKSEFLLVDQDGSIRSVIPYRRELVRPKINPAPLLIALKPHNPSLPLRMEDPFSDWHQKIFSVAPLVIEGKDGFFVVTLASETLEFYVRKTGQYYVVTSVLLGMLISILSSLLIGYLLSAHLRRRFLALRNAISAFESGDYSQRANDNTGDEISELSQAFNRMAETIVDNVEQLKRKDQLRRELIANISHDLRGPVTSIIGYADTLLQRPSNEEEKKEYASIIHENALRQQQMVDDLFQLASLEANESKPRKGFSSLPHIIKNVVESQMPLAHKKSLTVEVQIPTQLPQVYVDAAMIQRVLQNLLGNAIRYTPQGGKIEISAQAKNEAVMCCVADSGIGIPEHELPRVFDSFYRANQQRPEDPGGTGLGLAIVKKLLDLHSSSPEIRSVVGVGTQVSFALPTQE